MTDYIYGPWTVHTPGECPVPPDALVQAQRRNQTQVSAEQRTAWSVDEWDWSEDGEDAIAYYRIARKAEWLVETGWLTNGRSFLGDEPHTDDHFRVHWPVIDGEPDFTRQPKWERV